MNVPLEPIVAALMTDGSTVEVFLAGERFNGVHVQPGEVLEVDFMATMRITGRPKEG